MNTYFVWTFRDVAYAGIGAIVLLAVLWFALDNWYDKHFRKNKKYYHEP